MTVIRPNSISGVSSITGSGGDISIFRADGTTADLIVNNVTTGIVTATTFVGNLTGNPTGSGANLTNLPAANLTGTLPAISGANLTGINTAFGNSSVNTTGIITATAFVSSQGALSNRNRIINGNFIIHERGGTIASSNGNYSLDRWRMYRAGDSSGGFSVQQSLASYPQTNIAGVIDNFKASAFITVTSAGSAAANNNCKFQQRIEGSNVYDLAFGTAVAKKVTVSFYVKCSLTGTFGMSLVNSAHNRSNVLTYTVNSASTWERKIVTFDGDTSGSWDFGNGTGLQLMFDMGSGSSKQTDSTGTWVSGEYHGTSSSVKLIHTNGATMQYAGVQLEAGSVATPFEHRSYEDELQRCRRYYQVILDRSTDSGEDSGLGGTVYTGNGGVYVPVRFNPMMRSKPTVESSSAGNEFRTRHGDLVLFDSFSGFNTASRRGGTLITSASGNKTVGDYYWIETDQGSAKLAVSAEL